MVETPPRFEGTEHLFFNGRGRDSFLGQVAIHRVAELHSEPASQTTLGSVKQ